MLKRRSLVRWQLGYLLCDRVLRTCGSALARDASALTCPQWTHGSAGAVATRSARGCTSHVGVSTRPRRQVEQAMIDRVQCHCSGASHVHCSSVPPQRPALLPRRRWRRRHCRRRDEGDRSLVTRLANDRVVIVVRKMRAPVAVRKRPVSDARSCRTHSTRRTRRRTRIPSHT